MIRDFKKLFRGSPHIISRFPAEGYTPGQYLPSFPMAPSALGSSGRSAQLGVAAAKVVGHGFSFMSHPTSPTLVALLHGPDQPGLVARVAGWVFERGGNILHADQHRDMEAGIFFQRVEWVPAANFRVELGTSFAAHDIHNVDGLDNRRQLGWQGLSLDLRRPHPLPLACTPVRWRNDGSRCSAAAFQGSRSHI